MNGERETRIEARGSFYSILFLSHIEIEQQTGPRNELLAELNAHINIYVERERNVPACLPSQIFKLYCWLIELLQSFAIHMQNVCKLELGVNHHFYEKVELAYIFAYAREFVRLRAHCERLCVK